jgi:hypothetical protein
MRKRFKALIIGAIVVGLMVTGTVPALAIARAADSAGELSPLGNAVVKANIGVVEAFEGIEDFEDIPIALPEGIITILGRFRGVWGVGNDITAEPHGTLRGVYGTVEKPDGTTFGFFGGRWQSNDGTGNGYLVGRYAHGHFRGVWRCPEAGIGGPLKGRIVPATNSNDATVHHFVGKWSTWNGQPRGYLKGIWAPLVFPQPVEKQPLPLS